MHIACALVSILCTLWLVGCAGSTGRGNASLQCASVRRIEKDMVRFINAARATQRRCGTTLFSTAAPVTWNARLAQAAQQHAHDMARGNFLDHRGANGSTVDRRITEAGYVWQAVGENIAAGHETSQQAVHDWLGSAGHCANIMQRKFTEIGAACSRSKASEYGTYWTLVLAAQGQ